MTVIQFLRHLLARRANMLAVCGDDVVPAVGARVEDGFVFAHEGEGDAGGDAAEGEGRAGEGEVVPGAGVG